MSLPYSRPFVSMLSAITTANTNKDGTGDIQDATEVPAAATPGLEVEEIQIAALADIGAATAVRLFMHNGSAWKFIEEIAIAAATGIPGAIYRIDRSHATYGKLFPIHVPGGYKLGTATVSGDDFNVLTRARRL